MLTECKNKEKIFSYPKSRQNVPEERATLWHHKNERRKIVIFFFLEKRKRGSTSEVNKWVVFLTSSDSTKSTKPNFCLFYNLTNFFCFWAKWTWCKANNTKTTFRWNKTSGCTHMLIAVQQPHQQLTYATFNRSNEEDSLPLLNCFFVSLFLYFFIFLYLHTSSKKKSFIAGRGEDSMKVEEK